ncbi:hypothetical protein BHK69_06030 [Bosea vaviloviae]|uniref:Uncharacterized protein n=1 Tax=Bosea vaviloviae TaxID=1526658 RepID=A0A1D7TYA5_9HYPH|nr:hypothetical protein BHK69_06030 [Bosea vaviloviae]
MQKSQIEQTRPCTKALIGLLQRNNIGVDLFENFHDAVGSKTVIPADSFMNVVRGYRQLAGGMV